MKIPAVFLFCMVYAVLGKLKLDPEILKQLREKPTLTVFVSFKQSNTQSIRESFASVKNKLTSRTTKLNTLYQLLKDHSDQTQLNVRTFLEGQMSTKPISVFQSWMTNELIIKGIDRDTIAALEKMEDIKDIRADRLIHWYEPPASTNQLEDKMMDSNQWGVQAVRAPEVWTMGYNGEGVVVGTIDTGVRGTHEALRNNHREEHGWFDPIHGDVTPTDNNGHGTHTMGTIAGQTNGIGVAPGSKWIACKGCNGGCNKSDLIICGNFMGCPTDVTGRNAKCELAPHLVSNSWGGGRGDHFYDEIVSTWILADITPFFSAGNYGFDGCKTVASPGDNMDVITVGATNSSNRLAPFSSRGPTHPDMHMKPDVSAPGSTIISSYNNEDNSYRSLDGTSMACPHAAGVAALLYSRNSGLNYSEIKTALVLGAQQILPNGEICAGIADNVYPNNHVGAGRVDAVVSIHTIK